MRLPCLRAALGAGIGHDGVEHPAHDQDDQVVDQRQRRRLAEVELPERDLDELDRDERRRIARAAAGHHERLGVDHEAVHEAQQHRDQQHAVHLRQLDRGEHRPARGAVDLRRLIIGVGDRFQPGIAQQRDQAGPVPDVHHDDGGPGVELVGDVVVVDADAVQHIAEQADVGPPEDLPDGADHVPRNQQRQRQDHEAGRDRPALARHRQRHHDAERHLDREDHGGEEQIAPQRGEEAARRDRSRDRAIP